MRDEVDETRRLVAEATKRALIAVAVSAHDDAALSGLCAEGRWEVAIGAMRAFDTTGIARSPTHE